MRYAAEAFFHFWLTYLECLALITSGWYLAFHSHALVSFFSTEKNLKTAICAKMLAICGWLSFVTGCLIGAFTFVLIAIALFSK